jgi:hypothetical protein
VSPFGVTRNASSFHTIVRPGALLSFASLLILVNTSRSALPFESAIAETSTPKRLRRVRYRSTSNRLSSDWVSTIEIEVPLENVKSADDDIESPSISESASQHVVDSTDTIAAPNVKHAYERSWHILCPDRWVLSSSSSDRDADCLYSAIPLVIGI